MRGLAGLRRWRAGQGFTLVELLLATILLMLLLSAVVFNYSVLQRGAALEEGAAQVEALLHFARAQAAYTGRRVQLNFEEDVPEDFGAVFGGIHMLWEPDPLGRPGQFEDFIAATNFVARILDLVEVESVTLLEDGVSAATVPQPEGTPEPSAASGAEEFFAPVPPINFYPDGSSDSAVIMLYSKSDDDPRRIMVRLIGLTGAIRREFVVSEGETDEAEPSDKPPSANQKGVAAESARPAPKPAAVDSAPPSGTEGSSP